MGRKEDEEREAERQKHRQHEGKGPPHHSSAGGNPPEHAEGSGKPDQPATKPVEPEEVPDDPTHRPGAVSTPKGKAKGKDDDPKTMPLAAYNKLAAEGGLEAYAAQHGFVYQGATFEGDTVTLK